MRTISWVLLTLATLMIILAGAGSAGIAYFASATNDVIIPNVSLGDLEIEEEVVTALRGRRGTAAAFALGFATLVLFIVLGPYRKGEVWAWWGLLLAFLIVGGTIFLRLVALSTSQGTLPAVVVLMVALVGLIFDAGRLSRSKKSG